MNLGFSEPWALLLAATAILPWLARGQTALPYSAVFMIPDDPLSETIDRLLRLAGALAALCLALGLAGPYSREQWVEKTGTGAHIDRKSVV